MNFNAKRFKREETAKTRVFKIDKEPSTSVFSELMFLVMKISIIIIAFLLIFTLVFGMLRCSGTSMFPAIKDGDLVLYYRLDKDYIASDALVLSYEDKTQVLRVVATSGDEVDIKEDGLYINGSLQQETRIYEKTLRYDTGVDFPLILGENQVFVLGDSRENSVDSRMFGPVDIEDTMGKVMTIIRLREI